MLARLQNLVLESTARGDPLPAVLHTLCVEVERQSPGVVCSVVGVDGEGRLRPLAGPSLPGYVCDAIDGVPIGPSAGSCGTAAYRGEPVLVRDVATDPLWADYRALVLPWGVRACWSVPIRGARGTVIGTFAFYFREVRGPTADEEEMVAIGTHLCAIALDREERHQETLRLAFADSLTRLANRASFDAALAGHDYIEESRLALIVIDVDNLKIINDTFSPRVGDRLLATVAHRIQQAAHPSIAYRVGGDEFAVLLIGGDAVEGAEQLASRLRRTIQRATACEGHRLTPSATIGLALRCPGDIRGELMRQNAYLALYEGKERKRGGVVRYSEEQRSRVAARLRSIGMLQRALSQQRLFPAYQPIVDLASGAIVGVEALARVRQDDGTILSAAAFHDALADGETAGRVTRAMVSRIAQDLQNWRARGIAPAHVGINLSTADFVDGSVVEQMEEMLCGGGHSLAGIVFEITESVYLGRMDTGLLGHIERLRALGAKIALDDFGTGFASLTHLMTLPIDMLKIDKSFVDGVDGQRGGATIVEGLMRITGDLGISVVAEGVETEAQRRALLRLGCTTAQGFLFARALEFEAITALLDTQSSGYARLPWAA